MRAASNEGSIPGTEAYFDRVLCKPDFAEKYPPAKRKRKQRVTKISISDKIQIVHKVIVDLELQQEVAKEFRVSK